jgi:hypothetical protein
VAEISPATLVTRGPDAIAERLFDETVILDPQTDRYVRLNRAGTTLWECLERPASVEALASRLSSQFGIEPERASEDAAAFVRQLLDRGLIELGPAVG